MKATKTFFLLLVVVGLGSYIWFHERFQMSAEQERELMRQAFDVPVERINRIGVRTPEMTVEIYDAGDGWRLVHPKGARASDAMVRQTLVRLKSLNRGELITPADMREHDPVLTLADFGLAVPSVVLTIETPAQKREYRIGDPTPLENEVYVKEESSQNIMLVSPDVMKIIPDNASAFRDRDLFPMNMSDATALSLIDAEGVLRLVRERGTWTVTEPVQASANPEQMNVLLQKLDNARIDGMVDDPDPTRSYGFDENQDVIRVRTAASEIPFEVALGGNVPGDADACYAKLSGQGGLVVVSKGLRAIARTEVSALRDRKLLTLEPQQVQAVEVAYPDRTLRLEVEGEGWRVVSPVAKSAASARVQQMISIWRDARIEAFLDEETPLDSSYQVTFYPAGSPKTAPVSFEVLTEDPGPGRVWLRRVGQREVLQVVPDLVKYSPVDVLAYLSRQMLRFDPSNVVRVSVRRGDVAAEVMRGGPEEEWTTSQTNAVPEPVGLDALMDMLSDLRAEQLVEVNPVSLKPYGLEAPALRVSIGLGGNRPGNRTLLVAPATENEAPAAMVQGEDVVFRLSQGQWETLQSSVILLESNPSETEDARETIRP